MDRDLLKKLKTLTKKEFIEYLKTLEMKPDFRLKYIFSTFLSLLDFQQLINNHKRDLKLEAHKISVDSSFSPAEILNQYIILEVYSFYDICKQDNILTSDTPPYLETLKDFRNQIVGHKDKEKRLRSIREWMNAHEKVDQIGMSKINSDFKEFAKKVFVELNIK